MNEILPELDEIFSSIDKKLSLNLASEITEEEIQRVYDYYAKEKVRFNQDQSQFLKPGRRKNSAQELLKRMDLDF